MVHFSLDEGDHDNSVDQGVFLHQDLERVTTPSFFPNTPTENAAGGIDGSFIVGPANIPRLDLHNDVRALLDNSQSFLQNLERSENRYKTRNNVNNS